MKAYCALVLAACWGSLATGQIALLSLDTASAKERPVSKVTTLLKAMLEQMEKEADEDEEVYDKTACWCETNDKAKTKAVEDAVARVSELTSKIDEHVAASARLNTEIKDLESDVAADQKALQTATSIRQKQLAEFNAEEQDLMGSLSAVSSAIEVLSKHHSMLQVPKSHLLDVAATMQRELRKHSHLLQGIITPSKRRAIGIFVQSPEDIQEGALSLRQSYTPQSGEVFGILSQMKDAFQTNLADARKEEETNQKSYDDLKAAKEAQIQAAQAQLDTKTQEVADADEKAAQANQDVQDTETSLAADRQFLTNLKQKCTTNDAEWEERQKMRQSEMQAVSKALSILSNDDARDLFAKTLNPAFIEVGSKAASHRRTQAYKLLSAMAVKTSSPRLASLALRVQLDAFTKVKEALDGMVVQLLKEKDDEVKHRDFCVAEFSSNARDTETEMRTKDGLVSQVEDITLNVQSTGEAIETINAQIEELRAQLKRAEEDRTKQKQDFELTIADQRATQRLLKEALSVLKSYYSPSKSQAEPVQLIQRRKLSKATQPAGFEGYKNNADSSGVLLLLGQIISDAKAMEADAIRDDEDAKKAYDSFVQSTNESLEQKSKDIVNKSAVKAKAEADLVQAKNDKDASALALEQLANEKTQLHESCDFITKNFDLRQTAREEEIEALNQAKAVLSGAQFTGLLQESTK